MAKLAALDGSVHTLQSKVLSSGAFDSWKERAAQVPRQMLTIDLGLGRPVQCCLKTRQ